MQRTTWKQIGISAMAAMLAVGCATGAPQRSPGGNAGNMVQGSTTGDLDTCSIALGNAPAAGTTGTTGTTGTAPGTTGTAPGTTGATGTAGTTGTITGNPAEPTANGVMIGNMALVALPDYDNMPTTSTTGNGTSGAGGGSAVNPPGTGTAMERTGSTGTTTPGATTTPPVGATGAPTGAAGTAGTPGGTTGPANAAGGTTALDRIRTACRGLTEIRVVTDPGDKARLAQVAMAMRKGVPVTEYMDDLARISRKATIAGGASGAGINGPTTAPGAGAAPGAGGGGMAAPAVPGAPATPAPGTYGTPPGQMGPGQTANPGNR